MKNSFMSVGAEWANTFPTASLGVMLMRNSGVLIATNIVLIRHSGDTSFLKIASAYDTARIISAAAYLR